MSDNREMYADAEVIATLRRELADAHGCAQALERRAAAVTLDNARLRAKLLEVWDSVPSSYSEDDPLVKRHARVLNTIIPFLAALASSPDAMVEAPHE